MNKKYLLSCLLILFVLNIPLTAGSSEIRKAFELIKAKGVVNKEEVDGAALSVVSFWSDKASLAAEDGSFATVISNQRPQKLSLLDNKKRIRALAIAFPLYPDRIIFDAKSTAIAVLFHDSDSFGQSLEVEELCRRFEKKQSFQDLVLFFKKNLKMKALEDLIKDKEYSDIFARCNSEIFGNDPETIKGYLRVAAHELQNVLP
jgi:hypothetical protein